MQIELLKTHTHQGEIYPPGKRLDLDAATANWLIEQQIAKATNTDAQPLNAKPSRKGDK